MDPLLNTTANLVISNVDPNGIQTILLNRPERSNALSSLLLHALDAALERAELDPDVRGIIITGNVRDVFSIGADLEELVEFGPSEAMAYLELGHRVMGKIERLGKPSLAAINGTALGGGLEIALACSFRVLAEDSKLGLPEISLGLIPGFGGTQRLRRIVGRGRAYEMTLTGDSYSARAALQAGLVGHITPPEDLMRVSTSLLQRMIRHPMQAITASLAALNNDDEEFEQALAKERQLCCQQISSPHAKKIMGDILRKQKLASLINATAAVYRQNAIGGRELRAQGSISS